MKFPLPADTFPHVRLSEDDSAAIERVAQVVVDDTLQQYHEHLHARKGIVDTNHWKLVKKKDDVAVFKERHASAGTTDSSTLGGRAGEMPRVLTVGKLQGDLDEVMYSLESHTTDMMRLKAAFTESGIIDCVNLATLVKPTRADPIRSVTIKWQVKGRPLVTRPFVRFRDTIYIESTGIAISSTGERIGYQLNHSVEIPEVRELSDMGIVRANMSFCGLYRQRENSVVDVFISGFLDPLGDIKPSLAVASLAEALIAGSRNVLWGQMKKLTWMLTNMPPAPIDRQEQATSFKCTVCEKPFGPVTSIKQCRVCSGRVCSSCRVRKELCLLSGTTGSVMRKSISVCSRCMHNVATMSAHDVAAHEAEYEDRHMSEASSVWSSSVSSASSNQSPFRDTERSLEGSWTSTDSGGSTLCRPGKAAWRC